MIKHQTILTERKQAFIREYEKLGFINASLAAKLAGYSCKSDKALQVASSRLLLDIGVQKELELLQAKYKAKMAINRDYVLTQHLEILQECREQKDYCNALRSLEGLGRSMGLYEDVIRTPDNGNELSNEQLQEARQLATLLLQRKAIPAVVTDTAADAAVGQTAPAGYAPNSQSAINSNATAITDANSDSISNTNIVPDEGLS